MADARLREDAGEPAVRFLSERYGCGVLRLNGGDTNGAYLLRPAGIFVQKQGLLPRRKKREALKLSPGCTPDLFGRGKMLQKSGCSVAAKALLQPYPVFYPSHRPALLSLAYFNMFSILPT